MSSPVQKLFALILSVAFLSGYLIPTQAVSEVLTNSSSRQALFQNQALQYRAIFGEREVVGVQPSARVKSQAGHIRASLVAAGTVGLFIAGISLFQFHSPSQVRSKQPAAAVSHVASSIPPNVHWTPEVDNREVPDYLNRLKQRVAILLQENRNNAPHVSQDLQLFFDALNSRPVLLAQDGSYSQLFWVHYEKAANGRWMPSLGMNMAKVDPILQTITSGTSGDFVAKQELVNALIEVVHLLYKPNPEVLPNYLKSQTQKFASSPKILEALNALETIIDSWGYSLSVWVGQSLSLGNVATTFDSPDPSSMKIDFTLDASLFQAMEPHLHVQGSKARLEELQFVMAFVKEGGSAANNLNNRSAALEFHQLLIQAVANLYAIKNQSDQLAASQNPALVLFCEKLTAHQVVVDAAGYRAVLQLLKEQKVSAATLLTAAHQMPDGSLRLLLERVGHLMEDLAPFYGLEWERELRRRIFYRETFLSLRTPVLIVFLDRERKHLARFENDKPIDLPGGLDFLMDPSKTGEAFPGHALLTPWVAPIPIFHFLQTAA